MGQMDWREEYKRKLTTAEEAVKVIKSGDTVAIGPITEPKLLLPALFDRRDKLENVRIINLASTRDPGWYVPGAPESFEPVETLVIGDIFRQCLDEKRGDYLPTTFSLQFKGLDERAGESRPIDVFMTVISPPDNNGFCSFGIDLWYKRSLCRRARTLIAEVDEHQIRTYGTNFIHVSEIGHIIEYTPPVMKDEEISKAVADIEPEEKRRKVEQILRALDPVRRAAFMARVPKVNIQALEIYSRTLGLEEPDEVVKAIGEYVSTLIRDGDTIQIGARHPSGLLPKLGIFDNKLDLGIHSEVSARGLVRLVKEGVFNGRRKTINPDKAVFSSLSASDPDEIEIAKNNPMIELRDSDYVVNINTISAHENMVAINNAISVDLTGQINSETAPSYRLWGGNGGQPEFHIGALLSRGGRAITLLRSTAMNGAISRIVPLLDEGSAVTIPRYFADYVVTEYGIARLMGKTCRERAEELIAVAHPHFRGWLREQAKRLFCQ